MDLAETLGIRNGYGSFVREALSEFKASNQQREKAPAS
jgi:hypothetical protein